MRISSRNYYVVSYLSERYFVRDQERHWVHVKAEDKEYLKDYTLKNKMLEVSIGQTIHVDATSFDEIEYKLLFDIAKKFIL